jgi:hypothetical protein
LGAYLFSQTPHHYAVNMHIDEGIRKLIAATEIALYPEPMMIVSVSRHEEEKVRRLMEDLEPFSSVTFDISEVSLVLKTVEWNDLKENFHDYEEEGPYRLITFDIVLDLSIIGYLAVISRILAEAGISIYALSTYLRDNILVKESDAETAMEALKGLIEECKR